MAKPRLKNNIGQFQKYATVALTKHMQEVAEETGVNVRKVVADKLDETYKANVEASYSPRSPSRKSSYEHTDTFLENIYVDIDGDKVKVMINENAKYNQMSERTVGQVYKFLTEGTVGGGYYPYWSDEDDSLQSEPVKYAYNYPTPAHLFEEHTKLQMEGFLQSLEGDIRNGKYNTFRYTGKKKKRKYYKGQRVY